MMSTTGVSTRNRSIGWSERRARGFAVPHLYALPQLLQRELADASGVSLRTITRLEVGGRAGLDTVRQLTEALEVKPADLMGQPPETN
jgi:DNA-binding Xre family transcriptional regulator